MEDRPLSFCAVSFCAVSLRRRITRRESRAYAALELVSSSVGAGPQMYAATCGAASSRDPHEMMIPQIWSGVSVVGRILITTRSGWVPARCKSTRSARRARRGTRLERPQLYVHSPEDPACCKSTRGARTRVSVCNGRKAALGDALAREERPRAALPLVAFDRDFPASVPRPQLREGQRVLARHDGLNQVNTAVGRRAL